MLARAKEEGGYDELYQRDLLVQLQREEDSSVDLVMAGDVLIYVGRLEKASDEILFFLKQQLCLGFIQGSSGTAIV